MKSFDGESWNESVLVSEPQTKYNWYPNMNEDVSMVNRPVGSPGIGIVYLKGMPRNQAAIKHTDFDIMFSSTGVPKTVAASEPADVLAVGKGGHLTTRAHNRHLIYDSASGTWYAFVGTSKALVKEAAGANALFLSKDGKSWKLEHIFCEGYGTSSSQDALLVGERLYLLHWPNDWQRWDERYGGTPGEYPVEYRVRTYKLSKEKLIYRDDTAIQCTNHRLHFYGSIARGTDGYLWLGSRFGSKAAQEYTAAYITRSALPDDASAWLESVEVGRRRGNSVAPDLSALEGGQIIAINHYSPIMRKAARRSSARRDTNRKPENGRPSTSLRSATSTNACAVWLNMTRAPSVCTCSTPMNEETSATRFFLRLTAQTTGLQRPARIFPVNSSSQGQTMT